MEKFNKREILCGILLWVIAFADAMICLTSSFRWSNVVSLSCCFMLGVYYILKGITPQSELTPEERATISHTCLYSQALSFRLVEIFSLSFTFLFLFLGDKTDTPLLSHMGLGLALICNLAVFIELITFVCCKVSKFHAASAIMEK